MSSDLTLKTDMKFEYGKPAGMAPGVLRVVANNPGPFTFKGTNTYIVGSTELAVIDPGPDDATHLNDILNAAGGRPITHVFTTHTHRDHVDGLEALQLETGALSCAFPRGPSVRVAAEDGPSGADFIDYDLKPDVVLSDGDVVEGADWALEAIHTPGHAPDHMCFLLRGTGLVFSGDHVMAWNTSVIAPPEGRMSDYLGSLERLLSTSAKVFLPGHGGRIETPQRTVKAYLLHRRWREQAVMEAIRNGDNTISAIAELIYRDLDKSLHGAALLSVQAHVEHLFEKGLVAVDSPRDHQAVITLSA